jgi:hypothetical protein
LLSDKRLKQQVGDNAVSVARTTLKLLGVPIPDEFTARAALQQLQGAQPGNLRVALRSRINANALGKLAALCGDTECQKAVAAVEDYYRALRFCKPKAAGAAAAAASAAAAAAAAAGAAANIHARKMQVLTALAAYFGTTDQPGLEQELQRVCSVPPVPSNLYGLIDVNCNLCKQSVDDVPLLYVVVSTRGVVLFQPTCKIQPQSNECLSGPSADSTQHDSRFSAAHANPVPCHSCRAMTQCSLRRCAGRASVWH